MLAAVLAAPGRIEISRVATPVPSPTQVRVRLEGCGVCASNLAAWEGKPWFQYPMEPGALGHEGWGRIDSVGQEVTGLLPGDRVAMISSKAYAQYEVVPASSVLKLPASLDPFPGEPLGCAVNIFNRSGIRQGDSVAIVGIGFIGALLTQLATAAGARVIAISRRRFSLHLGAQSGACKTIKIEGRNETQVIEEVKRANAGSLCDVVIEATGKQAPLDLSAQLVRERGRLVIAGYHQDGPRSVNLQLWNWQGLDVINAHERDPAIYLSGMKLALEAIESGTLKPATLYTHQYHLFQLGEALEMAARRPTGFVKAVIAIEG